MNRKPPVPKRVKKPFLKQAVFWQSAASLLLYPLASLPGKVLQMDLGAAFGMILVILYLAGIVVTVFWSLSNFLSDIVARSFSWQSVAPLVLSGISAYIMYAAMYGFWPFG